MTFDINTILILSIVAVIYSALLPAVWRGWMLLIGSVVAIYWLQPFINIRFLDFILPTITIGLTIALWLFTRKLDDGEQHSTNREDYITFAVIVALVMGMSMMRFVDVDYRITASRPPQPLVVLAALAGGSVIIGGIWRATRGLNRTLGGIFVLIVVLFTVMKTEVIAVEVSRFLRTLTDQDVSQAKMIDLNWLGFSYVAFRLIHTVRDRQSGKLPAMSLREYMTYVIFFPSFISGPIDRAERFVKDFRLLPEMVGLDATRYTEGTTRIMVGIFKKFVVADTLALGLSMDAVNVEQTTNIAGLWLLLYGYAIRLFFDFSGYSDIAIGIGLLFGVKLPENFDRPYLKNNITVFWQSWHMTLSNWARFYVFTPLSRFLLTRKPKPSPTLIVLLTQMATMVIIGLWHGVTVNFVIWGLWHGIALFAHKKWTDNTRKWYRELEPRKKRAWTVFGWFVTFHYVVLGWVWFALPQVGQSIDVFGKLFGMGW